LNRVGDLVRLWLVTNADEDLVEDHIVDNIYSVDRIQTIGKTSSQITAPVDEFLHAGTSKAPQSCPSGEPASPP
jgi:hypothetical protein